ncbi:MAG: peptidoglycan DD-metalloendopeptidase family protein [Acidobacteriota bacterium]
MTTTKSKHRAIIVAVHVSSVKSRRAACRKRETSRANAFPRTSTRVRSLARALRQVSRTVVGLNPSILTSSVLMFAFVCNSLLAPLASGSDLSSSASVIKSRTKSPARARSKSIAQSSDTLTIYGPRRFDRVSGPPATVTDQVALPSDAVPPFTLVVQNGDSDGSNRVSSATITLNGTDIFTQRDFNQNTATLTKQVSLIASNTIGVRISSATGSFLTITITSARSSLASISPATGTQGQNLTVTLHGTTTRWVAGQTRATFGAEVAVGGAAAGAPGPVTVIDAVTATAQLSISSTASLAPRTVQVSTTIPFETREELELLIDGFKVVPVTPPGAASSTVSTLAGLAGSPGFADGPSAQAKFRDPAGLAVAQDDSIYVADAGNNRIRRVAPDGTVTTVAGDGTAGFLDGPGASARFDNPQGVAVDSSGMIYVADTGNNRIRRIAVDGTVATLAGGSTSGFQDGAGTQARFNAPRGVALDNQGNAYVTDTGNSSVRAVTPSGNVSTVAGDGTIGSSDSPARFDGLVGITVDGSTLFVYVADTGNHRIRRLAPSGATITIAGADRGFADGSATQAKFAEPSGSAVDGAGKLIVADATNSLVRFVDPGSAAVSPAVSTLAGTGDRGLTNGTGSVARFFTPRGIAVAQSSAIIVADTGNHVLRRVLLPPSIASFTPTRGNAGSSVTIAGERFDGRAPARNTVRFTRTGGGLTDAVVTFASRTQLTVTVPADAATGPITVQTEGGSAISAANFEVIANTPIISDFNPKNGTVGTEVTLTGTALKAVTGPTVVTFAGSNNSRLAALVTFVTPTSVRTIVPNGAVTGVIDLTNSLGRADTATAFTVDPGQNDYRLTIAPSSTTAVQASTATFVVFVTSPSSTFSQLVSLTATGLPPGATAEFKPLQITAGALSTLSVKLSGTNPGPGSYSFTIRGSGLVDGSELVRTANASLTVLAAGQTTLSGRVLSTEDEPIMGATASLDGKTATTDAAGAFLLSGVTAGLDRPLMVDGRTASAPNRTYPLIIEPATIVAGQANTVPYTFFLPAIDTQFEVDVVPGQTTVATNPRVLGLSMTIPSDAHLRNRDGSPVARASITPLAIDRTPAPLPSDVGTNLVYTSQPGGAISDVPMPVVYPNLAGADPGKRIELYSFNHDTVQWYVYGFGRVSTDGRRIEPEINPQTGRPYGLPDFSWHFPNVTPDGNTHPCSDDRDCNETCTPNTVDLSTGVKIEKTVYVSLGGARGGLTLTRIYTSDLAQTCDSCPFGRGATHGYSYRLTGPFQTGGAGRFVRPGEGTGRLFSYTRTDPDGALVFSTTATTRQLGDVIRKFADGTFEHRYESGSLMRFDSNGRLTAILDRNGNTTALTYAGSNLIRITDPVGRSLVLDYDSQNRIITATDPIGRTWRYTYEGTLGVPGPNGLTTVTDPLNNVMRYDYVIGGRLSKVTDKRGIVAKQITYNTNGWVIEQKFADGGVEQYSYGLAGRVVASVTVSDPLGRTMSKRFNAAGYVIAETDALGQSSQTDRDLTTNLANSTRGPCGCPEIRRQYDERGNVIESTDRLSHTERFEYEPVYNNLTRTTDKLGRATSYSYDSRGNLVSITDALNQTTTLGYDQFGQNISITDAMGQTSRLEYDGQGNVVAAIDPLGNRSTIEYDAIGRATAVIAPLNRRASVTYDAMSRMLTITDSAGAVARFSYDANGNRTKVTDGLNHETSTGYDAKNRPASRTDAIGRVSQIEYNRADEVAALVSPSGRTVHYSYDQRGNIESIIDGIGGETRFRYDNRRNLVGLTDQRGNTSTYSYDELYRPTGSRDPLGRQSSVSYDANDNLIESVDRLGRHSAFNYDLLNRLSRASYADAVVDYVYDAASRLVRIDDTQGGSIAWAYDSSNRVIREATPRGILSYEHNAANQRTSMTGGDRPAVTYEYDIAGRLQSISQGTETFTYGYDILSRRTSLARPNAVTTSYNYDELDRLVRLQHAKAGGAPIEDYRYTYNVDDEIASITSLASSHLMPGTKTATAADGANRITQFGSASFAFDNEGQTSSKNDASGLTTYQWDARGRLVRVTPPSNQVVEYSYDALGRRSSRTTGSLTTTFLYDGDDIVLDRGSDSTVVDYINGSAIDEKLRQATSTGTDGPLYFLQDHLGSIAGLVDSIGGIAERIQYEPFGESTANALSRYAFTGRERDSATGLLYYRARWYDPREGRFLTEDPIPFRSGDAAYAYVGNQPTAYTDPFGLEQVRPYARVEDFASKPRRFNSAELAFIAWVLKKCGVNPITRMPGINLAESGKIGELRKGIGGSGKFHGRTGGKHEGIDIRASVGQAAYSASKGEIIYSGWVNGYGNTVIIKHCDSAFTLYAHLKDASDLAKGDVVKTGDFVGWAGRTGNPPAGQLESEDHLHFGFSSTNPWPLRKGQSFDDPGDFLNNPCPCDKKKDKK